MKYKLSRYIHTIENEEILDDHVILFSTRSGTSIEVKKGLYEKICNLETTQIPEEIFINLIKNEFYVPEFEDELREILSDNIMSVDHQDLKTLSYVIQPSGNCQLGCHYCGQLHTNKSMSKEVLDLTYDRIITKMESLSNDLEHLSITWYGGEPLTGLSAISNLSTRLISLCEEKNLKYSSRIITNALSLKYSLFEKLVKNYRVTEYQITIDGTQEFHDKRRYLKNGSNSFDIIIKNIKEIVNSGLYQKEASFNIRCNVDKENSYNVIDFIDYLEAEGILQHVSFYLAPIHDWGDNKATIKGVSKEEFAELEIEVYMKLLQSKAKFKTQIIPERVTKPCMVVSQTSEVFDAFGNVSTCWEIPYTPKYDNSEFYAGNIVKDKDVDSKNVVMRNWFNEIPDNNSWCKSCKFLPLCGGACPKNWYDNIPACPSFKFNIDDRILLQRYINEQAVLS